MPKGTPGKPPKAPPPGPAAGRKGRAGARPNLKLGQARKLLAKHYASKYQTMRRR